MLPFLVVIVLRAGRSWFPTEDMAVIALRARDVTTGRFPLTGAWSRVGFAHPGPAFYWVLGSASAVTRSIRTMERATNAIPASMVRPMLTADSMSR